MEHLAGDWKLGAPLGEGGMGEVYLASHAALGTRAAVKVLPRALTDEPKFQERFFQEAVTQAALNHEQIAKVLDYFEQEGRFYLVMEYCEGGTLADRVEAGRVSVPEA